MPQEKDRGNKLKAGALGVGGTGLGASIIKKTYDKGNLTGRETLFHGTSAERAKQIRKEGLLSKFTGHPGSTTAATKASDEELYNKLLGKVFLTPEKGIARGYSEMTTRSEMPKARLRERLAPINPFFREGIVKAKVPTWKVKPVPNPHAVGTFEEFSEYMKKNINPNLSRSHLKRQYRLLTEDVRVFEGDLPTRYIKGSKDFKRLDSKELKDYIKANPKRFAKGVGTAALGVGIAGASIYGAKKMIDKHREMKKEASLRDFIKRIRERFSRSRIKQPALPAPPFTEALPAPKPKVDWEKVIRDAGRNRQTVEIQYVDRHGVVSTREVEPYEIKDGHFWGYSLDANKPGIRKFNLERIQNIKPTSNTFDPRWEVKLAAAMRTPSRNEGEWGETDFMPDGEDKRLRRAYERLRKGNRYTVNKSNLYIKMKLRGGNPYSKQV